MQDLVQDLVNSVLNILSEIELATNRLCPLKKEKNYLFCVLRNFRFVELSKEVLCNIDSKNCAFVLMYISKPVLSYFTTYLLELSEYQM